MSSTEIQTRFIGLSEDEARTVDVIAISIRKTGINRISRMEFDVMLRRITRHIEGKLGMPALKRQRPRLQGGVADESSPD
jgi:hypothetical protein